MFEVEHILLTDPDDPKIREVTTRMSRYACGLETERERFDERAYVVETEVPLVFTRHAPDRAGPEKHTYLITKEEKDGSRIFLAPGVIVLIMFMKKRMDERSAEDAKKILQGYFLKRIKGAYADGNDILIGGKKMMGLTILYNKACGTAMVRFMLTMKSDGIKSVACGEDFAETKYAGIAGACDGAGMGEGEARVMVDEFIAFARGLEVQPWQR